MRKIIIVLLLIFAIGCKKTYVRTPDEPIKPAEEAVEEEVMMPEEVKEEVIEEVAIAKEERITEEELSPEEKAKSIFKDVLFDYDKYNIKPDARPTLDAVSSFLNENTGMNVIVEGHCDERGTNEYNLALGEKRAKSTKNYLVSLGVSPARIIIVTYGEEKPVCTDRDEACWQSNRRAHFVVAK
jgi:peptidoglycan-associated lipoprotein